MAPQQGPSRRNGVIGFTMMGAPTPVIPPTPNPPSAPSNNHGPPHRITPLVGPDTAHSTFWGQSTAPSQTQRDLSALSERLADAESTVHRQESELADVRSQASALKAQLTKQRSTTRFVDQNEMDRMIHRSTDNRSKEIDAQLETITSRLDEVSEDLVRAKGDKAALRDWQRRVRKDREDIRELRVLVAGAKNMEQQARFRAVESRFQGLLGSMENMLAVAIQKTSAGQAPSHTLPTSVSTVKEPVVVCHPVVGSEQPSSHGQALDSQPQKVDKGKGRGPRVLPREEWECDENLVPIGKRPVHDFEQFSELKPTNSHVTPREGTPMSVWVETSREGTPMSVCFDNSREGSPMSVCTQTSREGSPMSVCFDIETDEFMDWEPVYEPMFTPRQLELAKLNYGFMDWEIVRKRVGVDISDDDQPPRKKRVTQEIVEANGSVLLPKSGVDVMNTVPKVPEVSVPAVSQPAQSVHVSIEAVPTQAVTSEPAVSQPTQTVQGGIDTVSTVEVPNEAAVSVPAVPKPTQAVLTQTVMSEPAVSQPTQTVQECIDTVSTVEVPNEAAVSVPAVPKPTQAASETTLHGSIAPGDTLVAPTVLITSDEVAGALAPSKPTPTESTQIIEPSSAEKIPSVPAVTKPTPNQSDATWQPEDELVVPSLRTGTRSHLDILLTRRAARTQARSDIMSSEGLQVTATSPTISTSSMVASPEDASVKNAVATGTDSRAGVSKGAKKVEYAKPLPCSAQQTAEEQRVEMGGAEAATSGFQMPGAWPSYPPAVTASDESDMQKGSAFLRGLWTGARRLSFGVFAMVMMILLMILLSFPLWAGHLGHLVYALEGPEQFLEELRWEHGYGVPFVEQIIFFLLRCFAGDRTLFG
ncbi:uncharacterized protein PGRI_060130 [Penicillium griseofulvum]|uniref:Uncharacterized protein n=1 Tax=Penicillium patulum TaxID=5078 RepID=A0A135LM73_PENPA|nr:uncharacterized protein PGRI_060130 [Penicillium griseofulvum]KXG50046.1 hypothetical protein PGRI_060130 [Penicillium griseofulvum]